MRLWRLAPTAETQMNWRMPASFAAVQAGGLDQALVHEQERSGAAWTLEWLLLPQLLVATAASLRTAADLAAGIRTIGG